jgi:phosphatidylinositol-3-phosphatase
MVFPRIWALIVGVMAFTVAGCSSGGLSGNSGNGSSGGSATIPQVQHVLIVTLENANFGDVIGTQNMPYLQSLLTKGALASQYFANSHPSLPNYFIMTTGLAITNDDNFSGVVTSDNAARELTAASKTWKAYAESIPSQGYLGGDQGFYLRHHNPFSYFIDVQQNLSAAGNIAPFSQFSADLSSGNLPNYSFIIPNAEDDAHSCSDGSLTNCSLSSRLQTADQWLQNNIAPLLADSRFQQSGLLVITFDESADDATNGGGHVVTILLGTHVKPGYTGNKATYDHRSLLSLSMKALGVPTIPNGADSAPQMTEFFQ